MIESREIIGRMKSNIYTLINGHIYYCCKTEKKTGNTKSLYYKTMF